MHHPLHAHQPSATGVRTPGHPQRVLSPMDRLSEVLFGLIMVLTFTGSLSIAEAGREDIRTMLIAALGCNLAWGIIDGVLYVMSARAERSAGHAAVRAVRVATSPTAAHRHVADALPAEIASALGPEELEAIRRRLVALPEAPAPAHATKEDLLGGLAVLLLVFVTVLPVALPFVFMSEPRPALRVSHGIAIALLFATGHAYGRLAGRTPLRTGLEMVALGLALVGLTIALGG